MIRSMLIAGGSRGLSRAYAAHVAPRIPDLACAARSPAPHGSTWLRADLTTEEGIATVAAHYANRPLDALVFAGGTWEEGAFTEAYDFATAAPEEAARVMAVNLVAPIRLVQALLPAFARAAAPRAVFVGALSGLDNGATREVANSASKFGLRGAVQAMRRELGARGIGFSVINPGNVATPEVEADIAEGRFGPQRPIPLGDVCAALDFVLSLSPDSVVTELNLAQMRG